jgi:hypothetical protein
MTMISITQRLYCQLTLLLASGDRVNLGVQMLTATAKW